MRHEAAEEGALTYCSEDEFVEEEEILAEEEEEGGEAVPEAGPSTVVTSSLLRPSAPSFQPRSLSQETVRPLRADQADSDLLHPSSRPRVKPQRSFLLNDPTSSSSAASSPASSPLFFATSPSSHRRRRPSHSRNPSASSSASYIIDGHLAATNSTPHPIVDVGIDPLLLELERNSQLGSRSTCARCGKSGSDLPQCRSCKERYCSRECRVSEAHGCSKVRRERKARVAAAAAV